MSGNQQDVLIVLIRQTHRAQEDAKGTMVYIQNEAHTPQKPLQGLDRNPGQYWTERLIMSGNQQDVLIVLIRQTHRAQEDAKGTMVYIQNEAHTPQKPLQGLDRNPGQYWTERLINIGQNP